MLRLDYDNLGGWKGFTEAHARSPLFVQSVRLCKTPEGVSVTRGWNGWLGPLLLAVLGVSMLVALRSIPPDPIFFLTFSFGRLLGVGLVLGAGVSFMQTPRIWWQHGEDVLHVTFYRFLTRRTATLPREDLRVFVDWITEGSLAHNTVLALGRISTNGRAMLAAGAYETMAPLRYALSEFLGPEQVVDRTQESPSANQEPSVSVSRAPLQAGTANFESERFVKAPDGRLRLRPTWKMRVFGLVALPFGVLPLAWAMKVYADPDAPTTALFILGPVGALFTLVGFCAMVWGITRSASVDAEQQAVMLGSVLPRAKKTVIPFHSIAGLQICSYRTGGDHRYVTYELNLVLSDPPGARHTLLSHAVYSKLREQADLLARTMDKALWDHTQSERET